MRAARLLTVVGLALMVARPVSAGVVNSQGNIYNFNAASDLYSLVFGGPTVGSHAADFFNNNAPFSYSVTRQGTALVAGDTISAGEQSVGLQDGLTFDVHSLDVTVTSAQANLGTTLLKNALGASLNGATVHGLSGTLAYTILSGTHALYSGTFVFRAEDSNLTMGIATVQNGVVSVFLCGGSGGPFQSEPDGSAATLDVLDPNFDTQRDVDAATNGLGIELAFGAPDPAAVAEPAMLPVFGTLVGFFFIGRQRATRAPVRS